MKSSDTAIPTTFAPSARTGVLACALLALTLYIYTLHPGVGPSLDSIELQIAARVLGVIHPPGSPQYLLLGRAAMALLPGPNAAYRLNLFSALCGAGGVGAIYLLAHRLTNSLIASAYATLGLAVALLYWFQSLITELYALNALYVALTLALLVLWRQTRRPAFFWATVAVYAASFGNHVMMILLLPALLYGLLTADREYLLRPRTLILIAAIFLAAAMQYLYVPIRAAASPPFCNYCPGPLPSLWDYARGPLLDYLTGGPFRGAMLAVPPGEILGRLPDSLGQWNQQFMAWGLALGALGLWTLFRRERQLAVIFGLGIAAHIAFVLTYAIPDWYTFMTPAYVMFAPLMGVGLQRLVEMAEGITRGLSPLSATRWLMGGLAAIAVIAMLFINLPQVSQRDNRQMTDDGRTLLAQARPGAWLLMPHPSSPAFYFSWALRYLSYAEGTPPDMVILSAPEVDPPPGPQPYYIAWRASAPMLESPVIQYLQPQILVLDRSDERVQRWGLLPICSDDGRVLGYEVVALVVLGQVKPLDPMRWEAMQGYVVFGSGGEAVCPP